MDILMCINENYVYPMINLIYSIRNYNKESINLYVFSSHLTEDSISNIKKYLSKINVNINVKIFDEVSFNYTNNLHYSVDMFLRIIAYHYLPNSIDKILYLDADILALDDVGKLYNKKIDKKLFGVVVDFGWQTGCDEYSKSLDVNHDYFNSGVMLINLNLLRKNWNFDNLTKFITKNSNKFRYPDQDMLNVLTKKDEITIFDKAFNYQVRNNEKIDKNEKPCLIHFVGTKKPWNHIRLSKHEKLFWKNYKRIGDKDFYKISRKLKMLRLKKLPKLIFNKLFKKINN